MAIRTRAPRRAAPIDEAAANDLDLYAENTGALYPQRMAIIEATKRKIRSGKYSATLAPKAWMYWYEAAAKSYAREFGGEWSRLFPKALREHLSAARARDEYRAILSGEYN